MIACTLNRAASLVKEIRLDFICVSRLGFLLRIVRRRPISSTLLILLDRDWERDQDCFLGALLRILRWNPHLLIVVLRGRGWKNYLGFGLHLSL